MYEQIADFIKDLGFPIFVAGYLLVYFRRNLKENTGAIGKNTGMLKELATLIRNLNNKNERE